MANRVTMGRVGGGGGNGEDGRDIDDVPNLLDQIFHNSSSS